MEPQKPKVRLVGENGNAFVIMSRVSAALKKAGYSADQITEYKNQAMKGDYDHLLRVTMKWVDVE